MIGFSIGIIMGGESYIHNESIMFNHERSYETESFPALDEIIIAAKHTNTEIVNLTVFTQQADTVFY